MLLCSILFVFEKSGLLADKNPNIWEVEKPFWFYRDDQWFWLSELTPVLELFHLQCMAPPRPHHPQIQVPKELKQNS